MGLTNRAVGRGAFDIGPKILKEKESDRVIALAGNPNVGKSSVFNTLTGMNQHTGNWPGKTVATAQGRCISDKNGYVFVDLPGTYSLLAHSAEEEVARDFLCSGVPDAVVVVCDATCLTRNMNLVLQTLEISKRTVICVNLLDEAKRKRIHIDLDLLSKRLGVPVVGCVAHEKRSVQQILTALDRSFESEEQHPYQVRYPEENEMSEEQRVAALYKAAEEICDGVVKSERALRDDRDRRIDRILTGRLWGYPMMLLLLALVFWISIYGANYPSALLSDGFEWIYQKLLALFYALKIPDALRSALLDGVYRVLSWVVAVMLPPMAIFFPLFTLLEDVGYLPRVAYNLDRPFQKCNACGKQALTMCMGFGCNAAGVVGCRIIDSPRERMLAILTNAFVPCNGRFPTLITLITLFFVGAVGGFFSSVLSAFLLLLLIVLAVGMTFGVTRLLSATLLRGTPSAFTLELPPYRRPRILHILVTSVRERTLFVLLRAIAVAAPAGLLIWLLANLTLGGESLLSHAADFLDPFARLMGLDGVILIAFVLAFPANEILLPIILMAYLSAGSLVEVGELGTLKSLLLENGWTPITAICTAVFCLFHFPCSTTLLTVRRETASWRWTAFAAILPTLVGVLCCMAINAVYRLLF
ncbi:MAG: ferrous iron transporter B [Clostridia bacterium]|nr:ferrous iron transporter B [Clostridia bacterium]